MTLSNALILFCLISFYMYVAITQKVRDSKNIEGSNFTNSSITMIFFYVLGLVPLYILYQNNSLIITILKFIGLSVATMIVTAMNFRKTGIGTLSLYSIILGVVSIVLLVIYLIK